MPRHNEYLDLERMEAANPSPDYVLPINGNAFIVVELRIVKFWMNFLGIRDANSILLKLHCLFHLTTVHPRNLQQMINVRKALMPGRCLNDDTILGNDLPPPADNPGVLHLQEVDRGDLNKELWAHPSLIMCVLFLFRHHGQF